ncbi:hypothetical protein KKB99_06215, partial [bacterium]|nr:hypothetical protein [bacterium]MBU1025582.1 hypothetical protein [bacterium]
ENSEFVMSIINARETRAILPVGHQRYEPGFFNSPFQSEPGSAVVSTASCCGLPIYLCCGLPIYLCCGLPIYLCCGLPVYLCCGLPVCKSCQALA